MGRFGSRMLEVDFHLMVEYFGSWGQVLARLCPRTREKRLKESMEEDIKVWP